MTLFAAVGVWRYRSKETGRDLAIQVPSSGRMLPMTETPFSSSLRWLGLALIPLLPPALVFPIERTWPAQVSEHVQDRQLRAMQDAGLICKPETPPSAWPEFELD